MDYLCLWKETNGYLSVLDVIIKWFINGCMTQAVVFLPSSVFRTLEYLIRHLSRLATRSGETNMHIKNLAIVWAPNLLR